MHRKYTCMKQSNNNTKAAGERFLGCLFGQAVGDAIGLPTEGMKCGRIAKLGWAKSLRHRFYFGRGMVSDDTEHMVMVARALVSSHGNVEKFRMSLAARLRWWFICLPAGVGLATAKACLKNLFFMPRPGVFSAGNGPCMRAGIIGVYAAQDDDLRRRLVEASTSLTHIDPKALYGAMAVAEFCAFAASVDSVPNRESLTKLWKSFGDAEWRELIDGISASVERAESSAKYAKSLGCEGGVSGYVYHTIPVVLHVGMSNRWEYEASIQEIIRLGGDTDTTAAILGACAGALNGENAIPFAWRKGLMDFPNGRSMLRMCAESLQSGNDVRSIPRKVLELLAIPLRNLFFLAIVLVHGFSRMLPVIFLSVR